MASGTVLFTSSDNMSVANGYSDSHDIVPTANTTLHTYSETPPSNPYDLHDAKQPSVQSESYPLATEADEELQALDAAGMTDDDDENDAMGEIDEDYDEDMRVDQDRPAASSHPTSSESSPRSLKRKHVIDDEEEFMLQNPELYGLRRSGRARPTRQLAESSEDEQNDDDDVVHHGRNRKRQKVNKARPAPLPSNDASSQPSDDSDDDVYGGARARAARKKHRRSLHNGASAGSSTPLAGEVRFSTRRTAKIANYNEDDDHDLSEDFLDDATPQNWTYAEPVGPAIDQILDHRRKDGSSSPGPSKHAFEYMVKWQDQAHYHATWEEWTTLSQYKGFRRLENYFRKVVKEELALLEDPDTSPEERERWNLDKETKLDELAERQKVERVIGSREGEDGTEYHVKWKALFYESCTWESAELVSTLAQTEIDRYIDRTARLPSSNKKEMNPKTRTEYKPFRSQPDYVRGGNLREFQIHGVNFLAHHWCKSNNVILADEMGLGKTVQTVSFISWLKHDRGQEGPFIVIVPLSTLPAWAETFNVWAPDINYVVYNGNEASRRIIRENELLVDGNPRKTKFNVLLTTYEFINTDVTFLSQLPWQFMAVDEAHRLKNRDSQLYANLLGFNSPSRLLITGTPMQNTLSELSSLMDFLMPGQIAVDDNLDLMDEDASRKISELVEAIQPYMIRRTKATVENDLPPKTEKIIRVELADVQLDYYKNIITRNVEALNSGSKHKTSLLNIVMELKKASNHAFMFPGVEERLLANTSNSREDQLKAMVTSSGKMMLLDQLLTKLRKDGHRVLIFSQMVRMLDILSDFLNLRGYQFQRLDGTISAGARKLAIDHFNAPDSQDFCFLLSTRAGGLGINLMTADTVILFDSDWNPQADLQAMARAHRIGQQKPVTIYRLVSKDTIEEEVLERARNKLMLEFITIQRGVTDRDELFKKAGTQAVEPTTSEDISRILKKRGQKMFEQSGNQKKLEELDIDAVLENAEEHKTEQAQGIITDGGEDFLKSFEYTDVKIDLDWEQIIPKEELQKVQEEARQKAEQEYLESVIEENQPRKRKAANEDLRQPRAAKKRARYLNSKNADDSDSDGNNKDDDEDDPSADPSRPLSEKEVRNLIRAFERYGAIEDMEADIVRDARLSSRNVDVVKATLKQILDQADTLLEEERQRVADLEAANNRPITKKERRTVLFDFQGVKRLNAETLKERPADMHMIRDLVGRTPKFSAFRVPEATKPASYTCAWGAREDGMLCVGIARHGYGAWPLIRDDEDLGLKDKFFLEEHRVANAQERDKGDEKGVKSPGAVHLVRRAAYLFNVLRDKVSQGTNMQAKRALENHHRNNRKQFSGSGAGRLSTPGGGSASPATSTLRKMASQEDQRISKSGHRSDAKVSKDNLHRRGSPNGHTKSDSRHRSKHRVSPDRLESALRHSQSASAQLSSTERRCATLLQPILTTLSALKKTTPKHIADKDERVRTLKSCLTTIGEHISKEVARSASLTEETVWNYVADHHWPNSKHEHKRVDGSKLQAMYSKFHPKPDSAVNAQDKPAVKEADNAPDNKDKTNVGQNDAQKAKTPNQNSLRDLPTFKRRSSSGNDRFNAPVQREHSHRAEMASLYSRRDDSRPLSSGSDRSIDADRRREYGRRPEYHSRFRPEIRDTATPPHDRQRSSFNGDHRHGHANGRSGHYERRDDRRDEYRPQYRDNRNSMSRSDYRPDHRDRDRRDSDRYERRPHSREDNKPRYANERPPERHPLPKKPDFRQSHTPVDDRKSAQPPYHPPPHDLPKKVTSIPHDIPRPVSREHR